jgi:Ca2+-transporting ATPase
MRDGKSSNINVKDVVVGDRLFCENGKKLNADGILVDGEKVKVNESEMTGELELMKKSSYSCENGQAKGKPFLFKSCNVEEGSGWMIVTSVGSNTNEGQMAKQMDFDKDLTPLQCKLNTIVEWIGIIGIVSAALVFLALVLRLVFDIWAFGTRSLTDESNINEIVQAFIVAVTVVVMAVPEGLPLAVTISL